MFKYSKDGISVLTILDTRRAKKSGQFPVKVQVVYRRKQKYYSTPMITDPEADLPQAQSIFPAAACGADGMQITLQYEEA